MKFSYQGTTEEKQALAAYVKLTRAAETLSSRLHHFLHQYGLTISQFGVLEALRHLGPMCQKDLAAKILKTGGNLTMVIDNLEKRGLVRRERNQDDRRFVTVCLTSEGQKLMAELWPQAVEQITGYFRVISTHDRERLGALCRQLGTQATGGAAHAHDAG